VRCIVRLVRHGSDELKSSVAAGAISVKEEDRRVKAAERNGVVPTGPAALQRLPIGTIAEPNGRAEEPSTAERSPPELPEKSRTLSRGEGMQPERSEGDRARSGKRPWSDAGACPCVFPASVRAFLALCRHLDDLTREFVRATAWWTGARRE
jgi:hypothetical protein